MTYDTPRRLFTDLPPRAARTSSFVASKGEITLIKLCNHNNIINSNGIINDSIMNLLFIIISIVYEQLCCEGPLERPQHKHIYIYIHTCVCTYIYIYIYIYMYVMCVYIHIYIYIYIYKHTALYVYIYIYIYIYTFCFKSSPQGEGDQQERLRREGPLEEAQSLAS